MTKTGKDPFCEVRGIVRAYLEQNGFDGLYHDNDCGCEVDDLAPCGEYFGDCKPGHKIPCDPQTCEADGDCPWHIGPRDKKPGAKLTLRGTLTVESSS